MRSIINISLPQQMADLVNSQVKTGKYTSKSEFIRHLIRSWQQNSDINQLQTTYSEMKKGKKHLLKSLKDLG
jgi:putative addiction module CopG family antidote